MKPINLIIGLLSLVYATISAQAQSSNDTIKVNYKGKEYKTTTKREADEEERSESWIFRDTIKKEMVLIKVVVKDNNNEKWDKEESATYRDSSIRFQLSQLKKSISSDNKLIKTYFFPSLDYGLLSSIKENNIEDKLEPTIGRSWFTNIHWVRQTINLSKNKFFLSYGLNQNFNSINYSNKQQVQYLDNNGYLQTSIDTINQYKRNRLSAKYLSVPVLIEYKSKSDKFKIAAGAEFGFNGKATIYQKGTRKEGSFVQSNQYDMKLNPIQVNAVLRIQIEHIALYARYSVTDLYKSSAYAPNTNPHHHLFSVGVCLFGI